MVISLTTVPTTVGLVRRSSIPSFSRVLGFKSDERAAEPPSQKASPAAVLDFKESGKNCSARFHSS